MLRNTVMEKDEPVGKLLDLKNKLTEFPDQLTVSNDQIKAALEQLGQYAAGFYGRLPNAKTYNADYGRSAEDDFLELSEPTGLDSILEHVKDRIDTKGLNAASGGHLGYIPGGGIFEAAVGDFIAAVGNHYAGVFYASPGAVRLENSLIKWAGKLVGYEDDFAGNLTSGGSMANLIAIATARKAKNIRAKDVERTVVYTTRQTHHSLLKALRINGLHECELRVIPTDARYRMDLTELERAIECDKQTGFIPFLIVSNAGSTDAGAVDPLKEVAGIARKFDLWHHVDGAYGGFFLLTEYGKRKLDGIALADSVILDPHKGLFLPYGSGMVLIRDGNLLQETFSQEANYMQDSKLSQSEVSPTDVSPELSKHFRGMRMWLPLKMHGVQKFANALDEKLLLTRYFYQRITKMGFTTGPEPDLSVVLFRVGNNESTNERNKEIVADIHANCRVFISSTTINEVYWMRVAILSFRTHLKEVDELLAFLERHSDQ